MNMTFTVHAGHTIPPTWVHTLFVEIDTKHDLPKLWRDDNLDSLLTIQVSVPTTIHLELIPHVEREQRS